MRNKIPNYKTIYMDIIHRNHPQKLQDCNFFFKKESINSIDVIRINTVIFGKQQRALLLNQHHKSYDKTSIIRILDYQKENRLNNTQLALHFKLSRNTIAKWKKLFLV